MGCEAVIKFVADMVGPLSTQPLCQYFLTGYLAKKNDGDNFPLGDPDLFDRYERLFHTALQILGTPKEALRTMSEFNFDSGDVGNLEGGIGMLRVVCILRDHGFSNVSIIKPKKNMSGADIACERCGVRTCLEVKTITRQSGGRADQFFEGQLYDKILDTISKARKQLAATAAELQCSVKILACVTNRFDQTIYMDQDSYLEIVRRLERDEEQESLMGIDGVLFVNLARPFLFLTDQGKLVESCGDLPI